MFISPSIEQNFRNVESALIHAARTPDESVRIPTQYGVAPRTLANNIRSGARAWLAHRFESELSNLQFETFWPTRQTCATETDVVIRCRGSRNGPLTEFQTSNSKSTLHVTTTCHKPAVIEAIVLLYKEDVFTEGVHFPDLQEAEAVIIQEGIDNTGGGAILMKKPGFRGHIMLPCAAIPDMPFNFNGPVIFLDRDGKPIPPPFGD